MYLQTRAHNILKNIDKPSSVSFTITNRCNLKCIHCFNRSGDGLYEELDDSKLMEIAYQIAELQPMVVCLCGGEPLIRGKVVFDIIKVLNKSCGAVNIVSNGYAVDKKIVANLYESGIYLIQFSLDGYSSIQHDNFRAKLGSFQKVTAAIRLAKEVGLKVAVSCVPNRLNANNIDDIVELCSRLKVDSFRVMPFIPMGRGSSAVDFLLSPIEYIILQQKLESLKSRNKMHDPIDHLYRMPRNSELGYVSHGADIRFDGKLTPSTYLPIVVGNLSLKSLKDYWSNGLSAVWSNKKLMYYTSMIKNIYDFYKFSKEPYAGNGDIEVEL